MPRYRSAVTGLYVSEEYAKEHPETTVKETDKPQKKADKEAVEEEAKA